MLVRDPRQRISLAAVLQHPWLAQAGLPLPHCRRPAGARPLQSEQEVRALLSTARLHVGSQEVRLTAAWLRRLACACALQLGACTAPGLTHLLPSAPLPPASQFDRKDRPARSDSDATLAALAT